MLKHSPDNTSTSHPREKKLTIGIPVLFRIKIWVMREPNSGSTRNQHDFYSTFHKTPNRKKFSEEEWEEFTEDSTRQAVAQLASSPEFTDWVIRSADRIKLLPEDSSDDLDESGSDSTDGFLVVNERAYLCSGCWEELNEEFNELCETKFCVNGPTMIDLDSDEDLVTVMLKQEEEERFRLEEHEMMKALFLKTLQEEVQRREEKEKMLKYEEEKKKRRHELMNSGHWKLSVSKISNGKITQKSSAFSDYYWGNTFAKAEKDRPLNTINDQDMNLFLKDVTPWVELWVNYMWHFRPHDADWAMVGAYFVQLLLQDSIPSWYADGSLYKVSWCDVEQVFIPINEMDQHWCLAHFHIRTGLVTFYDNGLTYDPEWREWYISLRECLKALSNTSFISTIPSILDSYSKQKMSDYLPIEVQLEIMNKLLVKSLLQFRTVSKLWKSSTYSYNFIFSYGIRKSVSISFLVNYYQGFESYMGNVNHNFNFTPLNTNLNFSSVFPIGTCDGLWCFSYADNFMAIIWNPSIMKSIGVFIPYFTTQVETQRIVLGFGVRPDNLDPTLLKISYPYSGEGSWFVSMYTLSTDRWTRLQNLPSQTLRIKNSGQVVVGNFIYWAASDRCGLHDDGVMHTSYVLVSFDMINHQFQIIFIPEPLLVWLVAPFCITQLGNNLVLSANYHVGHSRLLCAWVLEVNGHSVTSYRMIVSVPTPYSSRLLGFNMDEEPIIEVDDIGYQMDTTLQVYHRTQEQFQNLGVEANSGSFFVGAFKESLILSDEIDRSFHPCVAKIPEVMMQAKVFDQKGIDHTRYTISFTNAVNVLKQGGVFGDCGDVVLRTSCRPYSYGKKYYACPCSKPGTDDRGCGYFIWKDDFMKRISSSGPSTPPSLYTRPSRSPSYSAGTSRSAMNVGKDECSNCKFLAEKIKTLEAKIKILEGTLEMERHPENHTIDSAAILHELYNDMGKLGLE
ncbi:F-box domain containing protein [Tanacetum coccineum]